jgi:hypothetical protein
VALMSHDGVDYDRDYIDIKLASPAYLTRAVEAADDPTRAFMLVLGWSWIVSVVLPSLLRRSPNCRRRFGTTA